MTRTVAGVDQERSTASTTDAASESCPTCALCGSLMVVSDKLAGPYCDDSQCPRRYVIVGTSTDASACARTVCGRVEPVSGYLRHLATTLDRVDWPGGTGGQQAILDAADALDDLRKDAERLAWCERQMLAANVFDPLNGDAWVWGLSYADGDGEVCSTEGHAQFCDAIDAAMGATNHDATSVVLAVDPSRSTP